jgi:CheY-like chemotaxis protein
MSDLRSMSPDNLGRFPSPVTTNAIDGTGVTRTVGLSTRSTPLNPVFSVLVLGDIKISLKLLAMAVRRAVDACHENLASNGVEGLTVFSKSQSDLVLTDINMPVMDGNAATRR